MCVGRNTTHVSVSLCTLMEAYMYTNGVILYRFITQQEFYESSWSECDNYSSNILQTILLLNGWLQN